MALSVVSMRKVPRQAEASAAAPPEITSLYRAHAAEVERWVARLANVANVRETTLFPRDLNRLDP